MPKPEYLAGRPGLERIKTLWNILAEGRPMKEVYRKDVLEKPKAQTGRSIGLAKGLCRGFWLGLVGAGLWWCGWLYTWAEPSPVGEPLPTPADILPELKTEEPPLLQEAVPTSAVLHLGETKLVQYRLVAPKDALLVALRITRCPTPVDVLVKKAEPIHSPEDADYHFTADILENTVRISRLSTPPLEEGVYYVAVTYLGAKPVVVHKKPVTEIPFTITLQVVRAGTPIRLTERQKQTGQVRADQGSLQTFVIDVPAEATALRIDLDEVCGDLDLWARFGQPAYRRCEAANTAFSPMGRESLLITPQSPEPLRPGRWYIHVAHPVDEGVVDFALYASFTSQPPEVLLQIPELPHPDDPIQRAIVATVEVATEYGAASGTLLTPTGLVLTNYHVVAEVAENMADVAENMPETSELDPVIVAVTVDPALPPKELFRGRVIRFDKERDLALVQITCGLYHQSLPRGYRFPTLVVGNPTQIRIGDEIRVLGFPSVGGSGARVSVTLTRGILSGLEKTPIGVLMKTDALIAPGSSGGAALDSQGRLMGVPTSENVLPEFVGRMSYIHPLTMLPEEWWKLIQSAQTKPD
jgi:hypothetical protein